MRLWIKATRRATIALFHKHRRPETADRAEARAAAIDQYNDDIARQVFDGILAGRIFYAHQLYANGLQRKVYHRSTRHDGIQVTHLCRINGQWEPTSHHDSHTAGDMATELEHGHYINIVKGA